MSFSVFGCIDMDYDCRPEPDRTATNMDTAMSEQHSPLILVDGSSYLYRAFFASQQADLRTSDGVPTGRGASDDLHVAQSDQAVPTEPGCGGV